MNLYSVFCLSCPKAACTYSMHVSKVSITLSNAHTAPRLTTPFRNRGYRFLVGEGPVTPQRLSLAEPSHISSIGAGYSPCVETCDATSACFLQRHFAVIGLFLEFLFALRPRYAMASCMRELNPGFAAEWRSLSRWVLNL